jgi:hypothetical protein
VDRGRVPAWSLRELGFHVSGRRSRVGWIAANPSSAPEVPRATHGHRSTDREAGEWTDGNGNEAAGAWGWFIEFRMPGVNPYYFQTLKVDEVFSRMADAGFETPVKLN